MSTKHPAHEDMRSLTCHTCRSRERNITATVFPTSFPRRNFLPFFFLLIAVLLVPVHSSHLASTTTKASKSPTNATHSKLTPKQTLSNNGNRNHPTDAERLLSAMLSLSEPEDDGGGGYDNDGGGGGVQYDENDNDNDDDDTTRDNVCKHYIMNFLNGSTDARDECEGLLNAYDAADCTVEIHHQQTGASVRTSTTLIRRVLSVVDSSWLNSERKSKGGGGGGKNDTSGNNTSTDDDVLIDDFYEAWECCSSIHQFYLEHCNEADTFGTFKLFGIVFVMVLCGLAKSLIRRFEMQWVPDAAACIIVGAIVGGILLIALPENDFKDLYFDNDLFLRILLPPIIFEASLRIDKKAFRRDLFPILTFAILGTFLSAIMTGLTVYGVTSSTSMTTIPVLDSLIFGALTSSIDPVATLGILTAMGVSNVDTLYVIVFGESLLNDGVSIVLFDTLVTHLGDQIVIDAATIWACVLRFLFVTVGSIVIGLISGALCTFYHWKLRERQTPVVEVGLFFCWALIPYYISDGVGCSGIISIMTTGFWLDYFVIGQLTPEEVPRDSYFFLGLSDHDGDEDHGTAPSERVCPGLSRSDVQEMFSGRGHLAVRSRHHIKFVAEVISSLMETAIFAYLGLFLFRDKDNRDFRLNSTAIFACLVSRTFMVVFMSALINIFVLFDCEMRLSRLLGVCCSSDPTNEGNEQSQGGSSGSTSKAYITKEIQLVLLFAGVRGAVSLALVENIPVYNALTNEGSALKGQLKAMTSSAILFTVFVFGASTYFVLRRQNGGRPRGQNDGIDLSEPLICQTDSQEQGPEESIYNDA